MQAADLFCQILKFLVKLFHIVFRAGNGQAAYDVCQTVLQGAQKIPSSLL